MRGLRELATTPAALNPAFALLLALFHIGLRKKFLFVDHLVLSLNLHSSFLSR